MQIAAVHEVIFSMVVNDPSFIISIPGAPDPAALWLDGFHYFTDDLSTAPNFEMNPMNFLVSVRAETSGPNTNAIFERQLNTGPALNGRAFFVERLDTNTIIQSGASVIVNTLSSVVQGISAVNLSNAFLVFTLHGGPLSGDGDQTDDYRVEGKFNSSTQLQFTRIGTSGTMVMYWYVIEHPDFSVQQVSFDRTSVNQIEDLTLTQLGDVNATRIFGSNGTSQVQFPDNGGRQIALLNDTTIRTTTGFTGDHGTQRDIVTAFAVEDTGTTPWEVEHLNQANTTLATDAISINPVTLAQSTVAQTGVPGCISSPQFNDGSRFIQRLADISFASSSQVSWVRQVFGTDVAAFTWDVVNYTSFVPPVIEALSSQTGLAVEIGISLTTLAGGAAKMTAGAFFFDSINGDDANDGLSLGNAKKTLDDLSSLAVQPFNIINLAADSVFESSTINLGVEDILVRQTGEGARPIINCMDTMTNGDFNLIGGGTNAYEASFTPDDDDTSDKSFSVVEDGRPLEYRATTGEVDTEPGTYTAPALSGAGTYTITIHATDSSSVPDNGKAYEVSSREGGVLLANRGTVRQVIVRGSQSDNGSIVCGTSSLIENCRVSYYRGKAFCINSGQISLCGALFGINGLNFAAFNIDGAGTGLATFQFCAVVGHPDFDPNVSGRSGFFVDSSGAPYVAVRLAYCAQAYQTSPSVINCGDALMGNCISFSCVSHWQVVCTGMVDLELVRTYSHIAPWVSSGNALEFTSVGAVCTVSNCAFVGTEGNLIEFSGSDLTVNHSSFSAQNKTDTVTGIRVNNGISGFVSDRNIFNQIGGEQVDVGYSIATGVTFTSSDFNVAENAIDWDILGTVYNNFTSYKAATGQDQNSSSSNPTYETELVPEMPAFVQDAGSPTISLGSGLRKQPAILTLFEQLRAEAEA